MESWTKAVVIVAGTPALADSGNCTSNFTHPRSGAALYILPFFFRTSRAITTFWISFVPSKIRLMRESR